jgi:type I restriction enzyme S subunit
VSNWPLVLLGEVADFDRKGVNPEAIRSGTRYVGLENITVGGDLVQVKSVEKGELASSKFSFTRDHILYGKLRPYLRKIARPAFDGICSTDIVPVLAGPRVDRDYLTHYLRLDSSVAFASDRAVGVNLPRISPSILATLTVPLPPLQQQRRIAAILDQAEALRAKRRQALAKLDTLTQSLFSQTNAGATTKPFTFQQVANFTTGKLDSNAAVVGGRFPFFTCAREDAAIDVPAFDCEALLLAGNNAAGEYSVKHFQGKFNAYQRTYVITLDGSLADYQYMRLALSAKLRELKHSSKGTGTKYLTLEILHRLKFHLPPLAVQRNLSAQLTVIDKQRGKNARSEKSMNDLLNGLQQRAFRGEL